MTMVGNTVVSGHLVLNLFTGNFFLLDSCQFHPGVPVFHDALKGWSCCKKRSTDFTEFLNIPVSVWIYYLYMSLSSI